MCIIGMSVLGWIGVAVAVVGIYGFLYIVAKSYHK